MCFRKIKIKSQLIFHISVLLKSEVFGKIIANGDIRDVIWDYFRHLIENSLFYWLIPLETTGSAEINELHHPFAGTQRISLELAL